MVQKIKISPTPAITIPYVCDTLCWSMARTLPVHGVFFDPYRSVSDDVARSYHQYMTSTNTDMKVDLNVMIVKRKFFEELENSSRWLVSEVGNNLFHPTIFLPLLFHI